MTVTTEDGGRQNLFAKEPPMEIMDVTETHNEKAEKLNGRLAMLGVMAALGVCRHWPNDSRYLVMAFRSGLEEKVADLMIN